MEKLLAHYKLQEKVEPLVRLSEYLKSNFMWNQGLNLLNNPLVKDHIWLALAIFSPTFANDFAKAMMDRFQISSAFMLHVYMHKANGRKACLVQGLFGAGKTFTAAMYAFLTSTFLNQKTLWVSHNNKPLEEAAKQLEHWSTASSLPQIAEHLPMYFKRILALKRSTKYKSTDVSAAHLNQVKWDHLRVITITTTCLADRCSMPNSKLEQFLKIVA